MTFWPRLTAGGSTTLAISDARTQIGVVDEVVARLLLVMETQVIVKSDGSTVPLALD